MPSHKSKQKNASPQKQNHQFTKSKPRDNIIDIDYKQKGKAHSRRTLRENQLFYNI